MRFFQVINIDNKNAQTFIDGIRLIADPSIKHKAHVTIKGPFYNESEIKTERIRYENQVIKIVGVDNFFTFNQNTVFLRCLLKERLKNMMFKPDYGNENPHITLYNGNNKDFAYKLFELLKKTPIKFQVIVNALQTIQSEEKNELFDDIFYNHLSYYLGEEINYQLIVNLNDNERFTLIKKLLNIFEGDRNQNVIANPCEKIINKLNFTSNNGLFYYDDIESWNDSFPFRVIQAIHQIKPYAFFSLHDIKDGKKFDYNLPFVFIFSNPSKNIGNPSKDEEKKIKRNVFNFGNAPIIIIDYRTEVKIYNGLYFRGDYCDPELEQIGSEGNLCDFSYANIITHEFWEKHLKRKNGKKIYDSFLQNLKEIRAYLISESSNKLSGSVFNRLMGRLLFIRYFIDRGVVFKMNNDNSSFFPEEIEEARNKFSDLIKSKDKLYSFFEYFKDRYNGDLFPISEEEINTVNKLHLSIISEFFRGGYFSISAGNYSLQRSLFDVYDFSIIPIELVSNVYERFMGEKQNENKAFYTPYFLADFVLENTVGKFIRNANDKDFKCPVLDPSCGSGIFLVEALRKIIEKKIFLNEKSLSNNQLWNCVLENIYGIDIDPDAIDIAIFSIYVTVLDYVEPKEISNDFKFEKLKDTNFFPNADYFDLNHKYNKILKKININFIIGNPPWGQIKKSPYMEYCHNRELSENNIIGISDFQIAQAFLIRVSDFFSLDTICSFVVTSKIFYNAKAKNWRKYFLENFSIIEIVDFSPVRTTLFEEASWPASIIFYQKKVNEHNYNINLTSVKTKEFFNKINSFIIDKQSVKSFNPSFFLNKALEYDWIWKVMLYGNYFDFLIIKRLKENFDSIISLIDRYNLEFGVGLKHVDGDKKQDATSFIGYKYIDAGKKELSQFSYKSSDFWTIKSAGNIPQKKDNDGVPILFKGPLALIKEGLTPDIKGVSAYCDENIVFTHSVRAIKGSTEDKIKLKSFVGLMNSELFSYYILHTGSSVGIDLTRANQIEQLSFPAIISQDISNQVDKINSLDLSEFGFKKNFDHCSRLLNSKILELYEIKGLEKDFLNYSLSVTIPSLKKSKYKKVNSPKLLYKYLDVFISYFHSRKLSFKISSYINKDFIGIIFDKRDFGMSTYSSIENVDVLNILSIYTSLTIEQLSKRIFLQKNIVEESMDGKSYLIIKSNDFSFWHPAIAWEDLADFIFNTDDKKRTLYEIYEDIYSWSRNLDNFNELELISTHN
jgi:hypothetical protein